MDDSFGGSPKRCLQHKEKLSSPQISCKICNKKFYSSQALGGHQNAHRQERLLAKERSAQMEQPALANIGKFYLDPRPSTNYFSGPFYGGGLNLNSFDYQNKLGISMNSLMIHKPSFHLTGSVARPGFNLFGHQGHRHDYWMQPTRPASKVYGNPKFGIGDDNNNGWEGEGQEHGEKISSSCMMNRQPQASEELDLTLKL